MSKDEWYYLTCLSCNFSTPEYWKYKDHICPKCNCKMIFHQGDEDPHDPYFQGDNTKINP